MNREEFNNAPAVQIQRSKFTRDYNHKTTMNAGELTPIYIEQGVLPGDTFNIKAIAVTRLTTPLAPTMDNMYGDLYFFYVPTRLIWEHWKEFNGENKNGAWAQDVDYEIPHYTTPTGGVVEGGFHDHAGIPTKIEGFTFSKLPRRAYELIYNEWFRDQNVIAPHTIDFGDGDNVLTANDDSLFKVAKMHDYFTSALPQPQKGDPVSMPLGISAPVMSEANKATYTNKLFTDSGTIYNGKDNYSSTLGLFTDAGNQIGNIDRITNMYADLSEATAASINSLRLAFATQRILEKDARGGTRYTEIIKQHFNVESPDSRQQRPEFLGSKRFTINFQQVEQTSATDSESPQGHTTAYSLTNMSTDDITKSFTEHGIIIGVMCVRTQQTYQQGLNKMWSKRTRFEHYLPSLANIGEQPIKKQEIYMTNNATTNAEVFGYQEAWAEYRMKPNEISGKLRSNATGTLDSWHYAPVLNGAPVISQGFVEQGLNEVDRTITLSHTIVPQFITDVLVQEELYRPLPLYSVPGMIDHF